MATRYLHVFEDQTHLASEVPDLPNAFPFAAVKDADGHKYMAHIETAADSTYGSATNYNLDLTKVTLTATTFSAPNGLNAKRGEINFTSGKTIGDGSAATYITGVYGRINFNSATVNALSGDIAAVYGKFDMNGATLTSGHIAPVQANIVNPPSGAAAAGVSLFYGESASGTAIGNGIELFAAADYFAKLTRVAGSWISTPSGATAGGNLRALKVSIDGADYFILASATLS